MWRDPAPEGAAPEHSLCGGRCAPLAHGLLLMEKAFPEGNTAAITL